MSTQLALRFDEVPVTCPAQERYHTIAPILSGKCSPAEQAERLNLGYSTVTRWLRQFREDGLPGLSPANQYPREPYTPERVIVQLLFFKCCATKASDFELSRVVHHTTGHRLHNETVKALLNRYFFWRHEEFRITWPIPAEPGAIKLEIVNESWEWLVYLALPAGWRFLSAPGYEDIWFDDGLLNIERF